VSVIAFASLRVRRDAIDDVRESLRDGVCIASAAATLSTRHSTRPRAGPAGSSCTLMCFDRLHLAPCYFLSASGLGSN
jgi:hypothetical protein